MSDIRTALEEAYEESTDTPSDTTEAPPEEESPPEEAAPGPVHEATADDGLDAGEQPPAGEQPAAGDDPPVPAEEPAPVVDDAPPPVSWNAEEREYWSEATPKVRDAIARREREMDLMLNKTAPTRKFGEAMHQVLAPHEQMLAAQGSNPVQAVQRMMGVASGLVQGNPQQKAQMVAGLMQQYNVDVQELANVISGETPQQPPQPNVNAMVEQQVQQRMAPFQQQETQRVQQEVANFAKDHEFYNDVREQMADVMDLYEKQGRSVTLQEAYDMAVKINPAVQNVVNKRALQQRDQRAAAAGSIKPGGGAPPPQGHADTLRGNLMDAWDNLEK